MGESSMHGCTTIPMTQLQFKDNRTLACESKKHGTAAADEQRHRRYDGNAALPIPNGIRRAARYRRRPTNSALPQRSRRRARGREHPLFRRTPCGVSKVRRGPHPLQRNAPPTHRSTSPAVTRNNEKCLESQAMQRFMGPRSPPRRRLKATDVNRTFALRLERWRLLCHTHDLCDCSPNRCPNASQAMDAPYQ